MSNNKMDILAQAREIINGVDAQMTELFRQRMDAVRTVAEYKIKNGMDVFDPEREKQVIERNSALLEDPELCGFYIDFLNNAMSVSRRFQHGIINGFPLSYPIEISRGAIDKAAKEVMKVNRRVCVVTDSGIPREHVDRLLSSFGNNAILHTFPAGEISKTFDTLQNLLRHMLEAEFTRSDAIVALGGGVVGDIAGFAASIYMRGIDFYNIPSTLLAQVDSSVGGKTAVDLDGYKNMIGAFYQPKAVFIDPELLSTLPCRQVTSGLCEALKMGATSDPELFSIFEREQILTNTDPDIPLGNVPEIIDVIIKKAIAVKSNVVAHDERESGLRRVLNFGHTLGHAIETVSGLSLLHGECVALGIPPMCENEDLRKKLIRALDKIGLPTHTESYKKNRAELLNALSHDKKSLSDGRIDAVILLDIGKYALTRLTPEEIIERI